MESKFWVYSQQCKQHVCGEIQDRHAACTDPAYDSSSSDRLQGSWQAKDPPVSLSQLNHFTAHVLQADAVSPLQEIQKH